MESDKPFENYRPHLFRVADVLGKLSFLPQVPLAPHGDHLPSQLKDEE